MASISRRPMTHMSSKLRKRRGALKISQAQGHILSIYSPSCDMFPVGFQEPRSRRKPKYTDNFRRILSAFPLRRQLETLFVLFAKCLPGEGSDGRTIGLWKCKALVYGRCHVQDRREQRPGASAWRRQGHSRDCLPR